MRGRGQSDPALSRCHISGTVQRGRASGDSPSASGIFVCARRLSSAGRRRVEESSRRRSVRESTSSPPSRDGAVRRPVTRRLFMICCPSTGPRVRHEPPRLDHDGAFYLRSELPLESLLVSPQFLFRCFPSSEPTTPRRPGLPLRTSIWRALGPSFSEASRRRAARRAALVRLK